MKAHELCDVRDLVVVVTGGAGGIGRGIADGLAETVDVASADRLDAAYQSTLRRHGRIDAVFANAGISNAPGYLTLDGTRVDARPLENLDSIKWNSLLATNLTGNSTKP